jgi:hypothetical protein
MVLGTLGFIRKRQIVKDNKIMLDNIANIFNNNQTILEYQKTGVNVKASTASTTFNIVFGTETKNTYKFNIEKDYVEIDIDKDDNLASLAVMVLSDSIAVFYGETPTSTYNLFTTGDIYEYKLNEGIEYTDNNNKYNIKISIKNAIKK